MHVLLLEAKTHIKNSSHKAVLEQKTLAKLSKKFYTFKNLQTILNLTKYNCAPSRWNDTS